MAGENRGKSIIIYDDVAKRNSEIRKKAKDIPCLDKSLEHLLGKDASNPGEHISAYFEHVHNVLLKERNVFSGKPATLDAFKDHVIVKQVFVAQKWLPLFDKSIRKISPKYVRLFYANMWIDYKNGKTCICTVVNGWGLEITQELVNFVFGVPHTENSTFMHKSWDQKSAKVSLRQVYRDLSGQEIEPSTDNLDLYTILAIIIVYFIQSKRARRLLLEDYYILWCLIYRKQLNFGHIFIKNILASRSISNKDLSYGMLITALLIRMGVPILESELIPVGEEIDMKSINISEGIRKRNRELEDHCEECEAKMKKEELLISTIQNIDDIMKNMLVLLEGQGKTMEILGRMEEKLIIIEKGTTDLAKAISEFNKVQLVHRRFKH